MFDSFFINDILLQVYELRAFVLFSLAIALIIIPAALVTMRLKTWDSDLFMIFGSLATLKKRETLELLLAILRWTLVVSSVLFVVDIQPIHIVVIVLTTVGVCLVRMDPIALLIDGIAFTLFSAALLLFSALCSYIATVEFSWLLAAVAVLFGGVIILTDTFYLLRDIRRFQSRRTFLRGITLTRRRESRGKHSMA